MNVIPRLVVNYSFRYNNPFAFRTLNHNSPKQTVLKKQINDSDYLIKRYNEELDGLNLEENAIEIAEICKKIVALKKLQLI